jgi:alpha-amylase
MMTRAIHALLALLLTATACSDPAPPTETFIPPETRPVLDAAYRPTGLGAAGHVFVHLFEWRWSDIARECEDVLGPYGYRAVQISPPQEHIVLTGSPWWIRYQPVSYSIDTSRSGTRPEFIDMVGRCRAAGVDIYVDAVINHMTAGAGTGTNGTAYTKYHYPGLYTQGDFHPPCGVDNYQSAANVQDCELLGLADLRTGSAEVQGKIADYLLALVRLGVAGFRIDAAKHIQPVELDGILTRVSHALAAEGRTLPYYFAEVIDYGGEAVRGSDYFGLAYRSGGAADITEFRFRGIGDKFLNLGAQRPADLNPDGPQGRRFSQSAWGMIPSDKAVVFVENHDTQRDGGIWHRNGSWYRLANVFMLAQPYGYPAVMSGYAFERNTQQGRDAGPPSDDQGRTSAVSCAPQIESAVNGQWVCEHRDPYIARMVGFRRAVAGSDFSRWWDNGSNAIAFSRGDRGFVAINREATRVTAGVPAGVAPGTYCDVITGGRAGSGCAGTEITVGTGGAVQLDLAAGTAIAIHTGTRLP